MQFVLTATNQSDWQSLVPSAKGTALSRKEIAMNQVTYNNVVLKDLELKADGTIVTGRLNDYDFNGQGKKYTTLTTPIVIFEKPLIDKLSALIASNSEFEVVSAVGVHSTRFDRSPAKDNSERRKPWTQVVLTDVQVTK